MKLRVSIDHGNSLLLPAVFAFLMILSPSGDVAVAQEAPPAQSPAKDSAEAPAKDPAETPAKEEAIPPDAIPPDGEKTRETRFAEYMSGATLAGRFTVVGKANDEMPEEEYKIIKCEKLPEGDLYRFTARIRYGETDAELPMDLPVYWAGDTPVISLTNLWIPGLGTFSSRVMIYRDRYAGTWTHGEVGGHLFGVIKKDVN